MSENADSRAAAAPVAGSISIVRVLVLLLLAVIVTGGVYVSLFMERGPRPLYPFSGQVLLNGKPVTVGAVMTQCIDDEYGVGIGELDSEGRFTLNTNGVNGVTEGTHRVAVSSMAPGIPPRPLVPNKYLNQNTTPLTIVVTSAPPIPIRRSIFTFAAFAIASVASTNPTKPLVSINPIALNIDLSFLLICFTFGSRSSSAYSSPEPLFVARTLARCATTLDWRR